MPDFQYQPPTGPLSGSEFERQTTRFFQQVQGAADAAQSTAIAAQITANEAIERAQASDHAVRRGRRDHREGRGDWGRH